MGEMLTQGGEIARAAETVDPVEEFKVQGSKFKVRGAPSRNLAGFRAG
jgi:hypothetical protein